MPGDQENYAAKLLPLQFFLKEPLIYSVLPASGGENIEKSAYKLKKREFFPKILCAKISVAFQKPVSSEIP